MIQKMIQIIEENENFIILNKPEGYSVHNQSPSVAEYLTQLKKPLHFVNRLDQETSGLMLVAQKAELHQSLSEALEKGQKFYHALLRSPWKSPQTQVVWSWPLSDKAEGRKNPQGNTDDRKKAETQVEVLRTNQYFTEVWVEILTGRQHQIRKHAALAKHPIVGDHRYNEEKYNLNIEKFYQNKRMLLHAEKLVFKFNNKNYIFELKLDFNNFFQEIK